MKDSDGRWFGAYHKFTLALFIFLAPSIYAFGDQSLTITLDPQPDQQQSKQQDGLRLHHETIGNGGGSGVQSGSYAASAGSSEVARVGVISAAKAEIRQAPHRRGPVLFVCAKDTPLGVVGQKGAWYGILMIDSSTGWVEKSKVTLLNYQVTAPTVQSTDLGSNIVSRALKYLGIPYRWGGNTSDGIDCSGFVRSVFAGFGINLPRVAREQAEVGMRVPSITELQPGDRLYFACKGGAVDHTGIYIGNGLFVHSSVRNGGVAVDRIQIPKFINSLVVARRS
jgi:cell wall-associated NlpC family hydrolase